MVYVEIKVYKSKSIFVLKKAILDIANQVFKAKGVKNCYEDGDVDLKRIRSSGIDSWGEDSSFIQEPVGEAVEVNDEAKIGDCFSYLEQFVQLTICKHKREEDLSTSVISTQEFNLYESINQITATLPVRNLRIEPQIQNKKLAAKTLPSSKPHSLRLSSGQCACIKCVIV